MENLCNGNDPLVSIIIPNYNHAPYLDERIKSILNQTYGNIEIIILDDHSTDHSAEVINQYKGLPQISSIVFNDTNSGSPFCQWKKGLTFCKGDIVWIAESDDSCDKTFLQELVDFFLQNDLCMAFCRSRKMDEVGNRGDIVQKGITENQVLDGKWYIEHCLSEITNASSAIFSKQIALAVDNYYWGFKGAGDWLFWAGIASKGKVGILASPLNYYRVHGDNTTSTLFRNGTDFLELKKIYVYFYQHGLWPFRKFFREKVKMLYSIKYDCVFFEEHVREKLLREWNYKSYSWLIYMVRALLLLKKSYS